MADYTHIIVRRTEHDPNGITGIEEVLYRASDGMRIGSTIKNFVVSATYNDDVPSRAWSWAFLDEASAKRFLREHITLADLKKQGLECAVRIEERDGDGNIVLPSGALDLNDKGYPKLN